MVMLCITLSPATLIPQISRNTVLQANENMAPTGWATKEEREFLISFIPQYETCQVKRRYKAFWQQLNAEFLAKFPVIDKLFPGSKVTDLSPEQKEMYTAAVLRQQQRLKEWFRWQMNPRSRNAGSTITKKDLRTIYSGRTRAPKPYEVFAQIYSEEVDQEKETRCEAGGINGRQKLNVWQEVSRELYDSASTEQKDAVRKAMEQRNEDEEDAQTPTQYLRYLKKLPTLLDATITPAVRKAGVLGFFTIVGPDPEQNGKITCKSLQFGDKPDTPVFAQVWEGHDTIYAEELARFSCRHEFPPEICMARSIRPIGTAIATSDTEKEGTPTPPSSATSSSESSRQSPVQSPSLTSGVGVERPLAPTLAIAESAVHPPTGHSEPNTFIPPTNNISKPPPTEIQLPVSVPGAVNVNQSVTNMPRHNDEIRCQPPSSTAVDQDSSANSSFSRISEGISDIDEDEEEGDQRGDITDDGLDAWNFTQDTFDQNIRSLQVGTPSAPSTLSAVPNVHQQHHSSGMTVPSPLSAVPELSTTSLPSLGPMCPDPVPTSSGSSLASFDLSGAMNSPNAYSSFLPPPHGLSFNGSLPSHSSMLPSMVSASINTLSPRLSPSLPSHPTLASLPKAHPSHLFLPSLSPGQHGFIPPSQLSLPSTDMSSLFNSPGGSSLFGSHGSQTSLSSLSVTSLSNDNVQPTLTLQPHNGQDPQPPDLPSQYPPQSFSLPSIPFVPNPVDISCSDLRASGAMQPCISQAEIQHFDLTKPQSQTPVESGGSVTDMPSTVKGTGSLSSQNSYPDLNIPVPSQVQSNMSMGSTRDTLTHPPQTATPPRPMSISEFSRDTMGATASVALSPPSAPSASQTPPESITPQPSPMYPEIVITKDRPLSVDWRIKSASVRIRIAIRLSVAIKTSPKSPQMAKNWLIGTNSTRIGDSGPDGSKELFWFTLAEEHLRSFDLGEEWTELVDLWVPFEASMGYGRGSKCVMSAAGRPDEWQKWKSKVWQGTRRYDKLPQIDSAAELGVTFAKWWHSIQPSFRVTTGPFPSSDYSPPKTILGDPWAPLRKSGENGFLSVMMLLGWWGHAANTTTSQWEDDSRPAWRRLVSDVMGVVKAMSNTPPPPSAPKRSAAKENIAPEPKPNKRRKRA
ncbi:hypothetical protein NMY22_g9283 [Coprinellus aureogranulatus]|nr:hypothetical protein NMY22_g9283 [Coprinellus aureogranulatus]